MVGLVRQRRLQQPRSGTRKLHYLLRSSFADRGIKLGRDGLFDVLREARLAANTPWLNVRLPKNEFHLINNIAMITVRIKETLFQKSTGLLSISGGRVLFRNALFG